MAAGIKFNIVLTLERIASIKITILLWNGIQLYPMNSLQEFQGRWQEIEDVVKGNIYLLKLPESLAGALKCLVKPIGAQISKWLADHQENIRCSIVLIDRFYWTTQGSIDRKKTVEMVVKNGELRAADCYSFVCLYCLENDIPLLWNRMPESERHHFLTDFDHAPLQKFWTYFITQDVQAMNGMIRGRMGHNRYSPYQFAFMIAAQNVNVVATEHFWSKLSSEERDESLLEATKEILSRKYLRFHISREYYGDALHFLLSQMNDEQQTEVFKSDPLGVLLCLTDWPLQDVLLHAVTFVRNLLLGKDLDDVSEQYHDLLRTIARKQSVDCNNCIYKRLFTEVWLRMPLEIRKIVLGKCPKKDFLWLLFRHKDVRNIRLMLRETSSEIKRKFLLSLRASYIFKELVDAGDLELLELFIKECAPPEDDVAQLKEKIYFLNSREVAKEVIEIISKVILCEMPHR